MKNVEPSMAAGVPVVRHFREAGHRQTGGNKQRTTEPYGSPPASNRIGRHHAVAVVGHVQPGLCPAGRPASADAGQPSRSGCRGRVAGARGALRVGHSAGKHSRGCPMSLPLPPSRCKGRRCVQRHRRLLQRQSQKACSAGARHRRHQRADRRDRRRSQICPGPRQTNAIGPASRPARGAPARCLGRQQRGCRRAAPPDTDRPTDMMGRSIATRPRPTRSRSAVGLPHAGHEHENDALMKRSDGRLRSATGMRAFSTLLSEGGKVAGSWYSIKQDRRARGQNRLSI